MRIAASAIRTHRRRARPARQSSAARRRPSRLPATLRRGRTSRICFCNTTQWTATSRSFVPVASAEYGIAAGHWRLTETTGNAVKVTYFDALWRPLLVREYDSANVAGTERFTRTAYDLTNGVRFTS